MAAALMLARAAARPSIGTAARRAAMGPSQPTAMPRPGALLAAALSTAPASLDEQIDTIRRPRRSKGFQEKMIIRPERPLGYEPLPLPKRKGGKARKKRPKRKKQAKRAPEQAGLMHRQSSHATRLLFEAIAPHVEIKTLHYLSKKIVKIGQLRFENKDREGREEVLRKSLDSVFDASAGDEPENFTYTIKGHPWMKNVLQDYFLGRLVEADAAKHILGGVEDETYPPHHNRQRRERHVETLMKAREGCKRHPIFWTNASMRNGGYYTASDADEVTSRKMTEQRAKCRERIEGLHSQKDEEELRKEADEVLDVLTTNLPSGHFDKLMETLEEFAALGDPSSATDPPMRVLGSALHAVTPSHSHLIAFDLGRYLYVDLPPAAVALGRARRKTYGAEAAAAIQAHGDLRSTERRYQKERTKFVKLAMRVQHKFASVESDLLEVNAEEGSVGDDDGAEKDDASEDLEVAELERKPLREEEKKELVGTLSDLRRDATAVKVKTGRPRERVHLKFTAIKLKEDDGTFMTPDVETTPSEAALEERIVFIDNLPIDISHEEIDQIYSRCGPLDSINLFNLRPDLDPGPLTAKQLQERRRKTRLNNREGYKSYHTTGRQRPRTPVYGMLRFATAEGYKVATCPDLSIFGCNIRRHPVLSIKHEDMTTLYLENISGMYDRDVENRLTEFFAPHHLCVSLDGMRGVGRDGMEIPLDMNDGGKSKPSSCQLKFEDFHLAFRAYNLLRREEDAENGEGNCLPLLRGAESIENCTVHWFRTPVKSMEYWTRELGPT